MNNKVLKDFRNAIHKNLRILPQKGKSSCFIIREEKKESAIKRIEFVFKNQDDVLILRQKENEHTINMLEGTPTNCCCDFIVIMLNKTKDIKIYFCELKSSYYEECLEKAYEQMISSKLFLRYLFECYRVCCKRNDLKDIDIDAASEYYYLYAKMGIANKKKVYIECLSSSLRCKALCSEKGIVKVPESKIDKFFAI